MALVVPCYWELFREVQKGAILFYRASAGGRFSCWQWGWWAQRVCLEQGTMIKWMMLELACQDSTTKLSGGQVWWKVETATWSSVFNCFGIKAWCFHFDTWKKRSESKSGRVLALTMLEILTRERFVISDLATGLGSIYAWPDLCGTGLSTRKGLCTFSRDSGTKYHRHRSYISQITVVRSQKIRNPLGFPHSICLSPSICLHMVMVWGIILDLLQSLPWLCGCLSVLFSF